MPLEYDWNHLSDAVTPAQSYAFDEVSHLFRKVAYDVYKPLEGPETLWELRDGDDGKKYLFALYEDGGDITTSAKDESDWDTASDREGQNVTLSYKQVPIMRFASTEYQFTPEQADDFAEFVKSKTAEPEFLKDLLNKMPESKRAAVIGLIQGEV